MFKNKKVELVNYLKIRYDEKVMISEPQEFFKKQSSDPCSIKGLFLDFLNLYFF